MPCRNCPCQRNTCTGNLMMQNECFSLQTLKCWVQYLHLHDLLVAPPDPIQCNIFFQMFFPPLPDCSMGTRGQRQDARAQLPSLLHSGKDFFAKHKTDVNVSPISGSNILTFNSFICSPMTEERTVRMSSALGSRPR